MVYYLVVFSFILVATAFSEPVNGPLEAQVKENLVKDAPQILTTGKPLMNKEGARLGLPIVNNVLHTFTL
ncbi:hypothetical protein evm_013898 [Chilo suppressalis]|nr:hypothetical protein evm_013898 [Chilo suppressalis]